jgi:indolepyruvate ferredoxin oxidoreductase alpha subunit
VTYGKLPDTRNGEHFDFDGYIHGQNEGISALELSSTRHLLIDEKIQRGIDIFEKSRFNSYSGPENPEVLLITCGACHLYSREAISVLEVQERVGLLKMGTTWPLPPKFLQRYLSLADKVIIIEEAAPFLEENVKLIAAEFAGNVGPKTFYGKKEKIVPSNGAMGPDLVINVLSKVLGLHYSSITEEYRGKVLALLPEDLRREQTFCPGCPHRASFWSIRKAIQVDNRDGFVCGDIGCYSMASTLSGFSTIKTLQAMGSGMGVASGFAKRGQFGMKKSVLAVSGDSTFCHSVRPALANAIHHNSDTTLIILDNGTAAMSGFQPHPGMNHNALGEKANGIDIARVCEAMGAKVEICDPFDLDKTQRTLNALMEEKGTTVLILRQPCPFSPERTNKKAFNMTVNTTLCRGEECGCNRLCIRIFRCPGLVWNTEQGSAMINEALCVGCGVCAHICPQGAIEKEEVV